MPSRYDQEWSGGPQFTFLLAEGCWEAGSSRPPVGGAQFSWAGGLLAPPASRLVGPTDFGEHIGMCWSGLGWGSGLPGPLLAGLKKYWPGGALAPPAYGFVFPFYSGHGGFTVGGVVGPSMGPTPPLPLGHSGPLPYYGSYCVCPQGSFCCRGRCHPWWPARRFCAYGPACRPPPRGSGCGGEGAGWTCLPPLAC